MMSDGAHLTSFGIEFQTEEEAKENERSPSVALLCAGLLRRGMNCDDLILINALSIGFGMSIDGK